MTFANPLPLWAFGLVVVAAALVAWFAYSRRAAPARRRVPLAGLRFVTLVLLVVCVTGPVTRVELDGARAVVVPILVDTSRSMGIEDVDGRSRMAAVRDLLATRLLPELEPRFQVEVLAFGEDVRPSQAADLAATARRSDLARAIAAVQDRFGGKPIAGIVLLSDGGDTSGLAVSALQHGLTAAIYPIGVGASTVGIDREVLGVTAAEAVLGDSRVEVEVSAIAHGHGTDPIELRLLENGRPIDVRRATPAADGAPVQEIFHVMPARGAATIYTIEIPQASGELVPENNARSVLVQPPARNRRVLLVEGAPGFEHSFMKRAWSADSALDIDAIVRKGKNEQGGDTFYIQAGQARSAGLTSGFPEQADVLFAYDALVLANVQRDELSAAQLGMVRDFVGMRGGGLLVFGARSLSKHGLGDTPIEETLPLQMVDRGEGVLPASASRGMNRVALTDAGRTHPVMQLGSREETLERWDRVPPLASVAALGGPRPGATVLAVTGGPGGTPRALVAVQRFGDGRSMVFTGEASWRWRMMLPASDRSYETFWRQALRWLALPSGDPVSISVPVDIAPGDFVPVHVLVRNAAFEPQLDAAVDLAVTAPDGAVQQLRAAPSGGDGAGQFVARFKADQPGVYRISADARGASTTLGRPATSLLVGAADLEMTDPRLNLQLLRRMATATGGHIVTAEEVGDLVGRLRAAVPAAALAAQRDLWHTGWSFAAIVGLLAVEWILRRRWGLR